MDPVLVLRNGANVPAGYLADVLAAAGVPVATVPLDAGAPVPDRLDWTAVVALGGVMGAYDGSRYPFIDAEIAFLGRAVAAGLPVLGICLGCQLLAAATGGRAFRAPHVELGRLPVALTSAGAKDPVVAEMDRPVLVWHHDTWEPPPGAELLATTDAYPQAFRVGSALGLQPHLEATPAMVRAWVEAEGDHDFSAAGLDPWRFVDDLESTAAEGEDMARRLFGAWLGEAVGR